jgi:hypothetical protein
MSIAALFVPPPNDTTKGQQDAAANDCREGVMGGAEIMGAAFMAELCVLPKTALFEGANGSGDFIHRRHELQPHILARLFAV